MTAGSQKADKSLAGSGSEGAMVFIAVCSKGNWFFLEASLESTDV